MLFATVSVALLVKITPPCAKSLPFQRRCFRNGYPAALGVDGAPKLPTLSEKVLPVMLRAPPPVNRAARICKDGFVVELAENVLLVIVVIPWR